MCLYLWCFLRLFILFVDCGFFLSDDFTPPVPFVFWYRESSLIPFVVTFFLNTVCCSVLIAPLQNMEFHELCPQLLLSYYSGKLQYGYFVGVIIWAVVTILVHCGAFACLEHEICL